MEDSGEIYLITCVKTNQKYIGQALSYMKKKNGTLIPHGTPGRWKIHTYAKKGTVRCRLLGDAIDTYGKENFTVETLIITNIKKLNFYEKLFIATYNTIHPNGYNLQSGGSAGMRQNDETKALISASNTGKIRTEDYKKKMSETKMIYKDLPKYVYALNDPNRKVEGYRILKHPTLPVKKFISKALTMEQKLQLAMDYLNGDEPSIKIPKVKRSDEWIQNYVKARQIIKDLPKYIYETHDSVKNSHGYSVNKHPTIKRKQFTSQKLSMEEKLTLAIAYIKDNNEVHRPNDSGSLIEA